MTGTIPPPAPQQIDSWQRAESNAVGWMRHWGFTDARQTSGGADGGIDVRSSRALAQVKFEAKQVGAPAVQRLVGARGRGNERLIFFSGAGYAAPAVQYADMMDVALFKYDLLGRPTAQNGHARDLLATPAPRGVGASTSPAPAASDSGKAWFKRNWAIVVGPLLMFSAIVNFVDSLGASASSDSMGVPGSLLLFVIGLAMAVVHVKRKSGSSSSPSGRP